MVGRSVCSQPRLRLCLTCSSRRSLQAHAPLCRRRLARLLTSEEQMYQEELASLETTPEERRAALEQRQVQHAHYVPRAAPLF